MWFALILVSLEHWKQQEKTQVKTDLVVICSHFSIFGTLETTGLFGGSNKAELWFALILVSLEHWKQRTRLSDVGKPVVICSHFSIFGTLETTSETRVIVQNELWFALILVSLEHWKQPSRDTYLTSRSCDLLSF